MRTLAEIAGLGVAGSVPVLAYLAVGLWLLRVVRLPCRGAERLALAYALGTGAASLAILLLRLADIPIPLYVLAGIAAAGAPLLRPAGDAGTRSRGGMVAVVDALTLALAALTVLAALAPETYWDGFEYHLPMVRAWAEGPIRALPATLDAEFRAGIDLLFIPALAAGQPDAAAAVSAGFALALAGVIRAEATRRATPGAGAIAGCLTLAVPLALESAPSTYVDLGFGLYGFLALLLADAWNRTGERSTLVASALFLAFAVNAKLHAAVLAPAILALVTLGGRPAPWRALAGCGALVAALALPWFAKAALTTGNPFFPFLGAWLGTGPTSQEYLDLRRFRLGTDFPVARNTQGFLHYTASIFFGRNPHVSGLLGPLPLALAPLAWHRLARPSAVLTATLAVLCVLQFAFMPALRFGAPLLPWFAVAAAVGGARLARSGAIPRALLATLLGVLAVHHGAAVGARYLPRIAALAHPESYARAAFPDQAALRDLVARAEPVVAIPGGAVAWMDRPVYVLSWVRNGELWFDDLVWNRFGQRIEKRRTPPDRALEILQRRGVRTLALDVAPPFPAAGRVGHPTVDAWLGTGRAALRPDPDPPRARGQRRWVLVDLVTVPQRVP